MKRSESTAASAPARLLRAALLAPIVAYQRFVSPALPRRCKYYPTCSAYAVDAIRELGVARGAILAGWRLLRCNPFSHGGVDPIENRPFFRESPSMGEAQTRSNGTRGRGRKAQGVKFASELDAHRHVAAERERSISRA